MEKRSIIAATTGATKRRRPPWPANAWRRELKRAVTSVDDLLALAGVDPSRVDARADYGFPLRVPRPYARRMRRGDPHDPLLRQVLPLAREANATPGYVDDPLREAAAGIAPGALRKYAGRVLLMPTGACAVHCRYCFRRHFPYAEHRMEVGEPALEAIRADANAREVILSGGDPLMLSDARLERWIERIAAINHVARLRIHTRLPIVIPQRVTERLARLLAEAPLRVAVVLHCNHANEIDEQCADALRALDGATLLNQSVLLRGVNDDAAALAALSERLFEAGVLPYYLHLPDAVAGTAHFDVPEARAVAIHRRLRESLPGYLVPRLARERPGALAKELVSA